MIKTSCSFEQSLLQVPWNFSGIKFSAIDKNGNYGAYSIHPGFNYALYLNGKNEMHNAESFVNKS